MLASLRMLLMFKKKSIVRQLSRHVSFGVHDLLRTNAVNIHSNDDWASIFTILQVYGAGATSPYLVAAAAAAAAADSITTDVVGLTRSFGGAKQAQTQTGTPLLLQKSHDPSKSQINSLCPNCSPLVKLVRQKRF